MKKSLKSLSFALVVIFTLSFVVVGNTSLGLFGPDVVSAATGTTEPANPPKVKPPTKVKPQTKVKKPTKVKTSRSASGILKVGAKGSSVKLLQTNLNKYSNKLKVDGIFGKLTLKAVESYQKQNNLKVTGYADLKTIAKLSLKPTTPVKPVPTPTPLPAPTPTPTPTPDVITSASVVNNSIDFENSISKNGKWIIAIVKDIAAYRPLVLEGEFKNGKKDAVTGCRPYPT